MKRHIFFLFFFCFATQTPSQNINIPDSNFKSILLKKYDVNKDGEIQKAECSLIDSLDISELELKNLSGIESFAKLEYLDCSFNELITFDISKNRELKYLKCTNNRHKNIDISKNIELISVNCSRNQLMALDFSHNSFLKVLDCSLNWLTSLIVTKNSALTFLNCENNKLKILDVRPNIKLNYLKCGSNELSVIDLSNNKKLTLLDLSGNLLKSIDVSTNVMLIDLGCNNNHLATIDVNSNISLKELSCSHNLLTILNVTQNKSLVLLACYNNNLRTLDVSENTKLSFLGCDGNKLTALDLSKNDVLNHLKCSNNNLSNLDVHKNKLLGNLECTNNLDLKVICINKIHPIVTHNWEKDKTAFWSTECSLLSTQLGLDTMTYNEIKLGTQTWKNTNLELSNFRNGDIIPESKTDKEWSDAGKKKKPAWCYFLNDNTNGPKYGKLYNWYAVHDPRGLAPEGWHIPSQAEWTKLSNYLGGFGFEGIKMKSTYGWVGNGNGTNSSGFNGLPSGYRYDFLSPSFQGFGVFGMWWSSTADKTGIAWLARLDYLEKFLAIDNGGKEVGCSVRCIKD